MNARSTLYTVITLLLLQFNLEAQTPTLKSEVWIGYNANFQLSKKWSIWTDVQYVTTSFAAFRIGGTRSIIENHKATVGYGRVYTATSFSDRLIRDEHRPWIQFAGKFQLTKRVSYLYRLRYDARFRKAIENNVLTDRFIFYNRARWQSDFRFQLKDLGGGKSLHVDLADEILYNFGDQVNDGIDQNRAYLFLGYTNPTITILAGYDYRIIPMGNGNKINRHGFTIWVSHSINLNKNK